MQSCHLYMLTISLIVCLIISVQHRTNANPIDDTVQVTMATSTTNKPDGNKPNFAALPAYLRIRPLMPFAFPLGDIPSLHGQ